jgi:hypothetical protein
MVLFSGMIIASLCLFGDGPRILRFWVFPSGSRDFQNDASYCLTVLYNFH